MTFSGFSVVPHLSSAETVLWDGHDCLRVLKNPGVDAVDEPTFARLDGVSFQDGTIEVQVFSRLLPDAPSLARGFIGVAFGIADDCSRFEGLYIRPTNGRTDDPVRRMRAAQYFAYPDHKFDRLREAFPGRFEAGADVGLDEWIRLRLEVSGAGAALFLNNAATPTLQVPRLLDGPETPGGVGLWVDVGTEGYFRGLRIRRAGAR